ncbi:YncE family protein [Pontibacter actiniarum]|uniref:40-residue YVTN family beta-propeller repeat-containing protein n=1 Tax=Pontibacter actiniarum TaxID=323450 RepID=A0A1X9YWS8_9BACT|nr:DUF5074 domain-containing protein [Pontibacter actiniarum]ARS37365.1 hypothetical protein CA264_19145 [Pontibacter actiniarum]
MRKLNSFRSFFLAATLAIGSFAFSSCNDDNDGPSGAYAEDGVFVVNEGNFTNSNASISFYNNNTAQVEQQVFETTNGRFLGDVAQYMTIYGDRAFIVVNNSNKMEVVNAATFKSVGAVESLNQPRYFAALNNDKGYVTEWLNYDPTTFVYPTGRISVVDLSTYTVTKTIDVGVQPEQLAVVGGKLYVVNQGSNTVSVINTATDAVEKTIPVADYPTSIAVDAANNLWVLSSGNKVYANYPEVDPAQSTAGALTKLNGANGAVLGTYTFPDVAASASQLVLNGPKNKLYYIYDGKVYQQDVNAESLSHSAVVERSFYGLGVDPDNGYIYGGEKNGFTGDGTVYVYRPDGTQVTSFKVGIGPNGFVFN